MGISEPCWQCDWRLREELTEGRKKSRGGVDIQPSSSCRSQCPCRQLRWRRLISGIAGLHNFMQPVDLKLRTEALQHHRRRHCPRLSAAMASKYAFTKNLKEIRFLLCQSSEHSAAARYATPRSRALRCGAISGPRSIYSKNFANGRVEQVIPHTNVPHDEEAQPTHPDHDTRGIRRGAEGVCAVW